MAFTPSAHNAALKPLLTGIIDATTDEAEQWVILESLCFGIGLLHGRSPRDIAELEADIAALRAGEG